MISSIYINCITNTITKKKFDCIEYIELYTHMPIQGHINTQKHIYVVTIYDFFFFEFIEFYFYFSCKLDLTKRHRNVLNKASACVCLSSFRMPTNVKLMKKRFFYYGR